MRSPVRLLLAVVLLAAASAVTAGVAGAQTEGTVGLSTFVSGNPDAAEFDFEVDGVTCQEGTTEVTVEGVPDATVELTDPNSGTVTLPVGTPGGTYTISVTCDPGKGDVTATGTVTFATVDVDKVVEGTAPAGATFPVTVTCEGGRPTATADAFSTEGLGFLLDTSFSFGAGGGTKYLVAYGPQSCTVSETDDGGASSSTIDLTDCVTGGGGDAAAGTEAAGPSGDFDIISPTDCTQTITNTFAAAPPAAPPAAQPADVTQQQPAFTG